MSSANSEVVDFVETSPVCPAINGDAKAAKQESFQSTSSVLGALLGVMGLAGVAGTVWLIGRLGEFDRIGGFITESPNFITFSATEAAYYPSGSGYLGVVFAGPAGVILICSLFICAGLGMLGLRVDRRSRPGVIKKVLPLAATLFLPLLALDYMAFSGVEFTTAHTMPAVFRESPGLLAFWVIVALASASILSLTGNALVLRWAWRREQRLAAA